jgi:hypothetical protein
MSSVLPMKQPRSAPLFIKLTKIAGFDMVLACISQQDLTQTRADDSAVRALLYRDGENNANSAKTACDPAVFLIAEPLAA